MTIITVLEFGKHKIVGKMYTYSVAATTILITILYELNIFHIVFQFLCDFSVVSSEESFKAILGVK